MPKSFKQLVVVDMFKWFKQLDEIVRGDATRMQSLDEGKVTFPIGGLSVAIVLLGLLYGIGSPDLPTHFFRQDAWGNAYVRLAHIIWAFLGG